MQKRPKFRGTVFDLGNTLVTRRDFNHVEEQAKLAGVIVDGEAVAHAYTETEAEFDATGRAFTLADFWGEVLDRASGVKVARPPREAFLRAIEAEPPWGELYSDVGLCVDELRRQGFRIGVLADRLDEASARRLLEQAGLLDRVDSITSAETEGLSKPDPEIFRRAAARLGLSPRETVYVGDLPNLDVRAASAAGLTAVWLHRDGTGFGDDLPEITSLAELPRWLSLAGASGGRSR